MTISTFLFPISYIPNFNSKKFHFHFSFDFHPFPPASKNIPCLHWSPVHSYIPTFIPMPPPPGERNPPLTQLASWKCMALMLPAWMVSGSGFCIGGRHGTLQRFTSLTMMAFRVRYGAASREAKMLLQHRGLIFRSPLGHSLNM